MGRGTIRGHSLDSWWRPSMVSLAVIKALSLPEQLRPTGGGAAPAKGDPRWSSPGHWRAPEDFRSEEPEAKRMVRGSSCTSTGNWGGTARYVSTPMNGRAFAARGNSSKNGPCREHIGRWTHWLIDFKLNSRILFKLRSVLRRLIRLSLAANSNPRISGTLCRADVRQEFCEQSDGWC